ncbi:SGNH/GDSL hydrolase family protein [Marinobacter sp. M1N3S26]|uniref:SGNH/GDSL hydrolase family protein n=1 Tax=unclassified Marinobacter TaxID=83889 RepID=UPI00387B98C6
MKQASVEAVPFPFTSRPVSIKGYQDHELKLWVSSASHAADHHGPENQFANLLCDFLKNTNCYVLNASTPGVLLEDNIEFLKENGADWKPDYVLLYQAYLDIHYSAKSAPTSAPEVDTLDTPQAEPRVADRVKNSLRIDEMLRSTILRNYSRNYLGSAFLLSTPLLSDLPDSEKVEFRDRLIRFIHEVEGIGSTPILMTFVSAHGDSPDEISWMYKTWLMRYFEGYSPTTVNRLVSEYNTLIREVGRQHGVEVIDLDGIWASEERQGHFDDFVHFSRSGHQQVAGMIAEELKGIVR